jgi:hypothetical protein
LILRATPSRAKRCRVHRTEAAIRSGIVEIGQNSALLDFGRDLIP